MPRPDPFLCEVPDPKTQAARNAAFRRLPPAERRVAIAKDVLLLLNSPKIQAGCHSYLKTNDLETFTKYHQFHSNNPLLFQHSLLTGDIPTCTVCAKGALFLAFARKADGALKNDGYWNQSIKKKLRGTFLAAQLDLIEHTFEKWEQPNHLRPSEWRRVQAFHKGLSGRRLLIKIMRNIIRNKGTFIP